MRTSSSKEMTPGCLYRPYDRNETTVFELVAIGVITDQPDVRHIFSFNTSVEQVSMP